MKAHAYFLKSVTLAVAALSSQAVCFYLVICAVSDAEGRMLFAPFIRTQPAPTNGYGNIPLFLVLIGLALAVLSLAFLIASFRRHEPGWGWRLIPITLLTVYLGTWVVLLHG